MCIRDRLKVNQWLRSKDLCHASAAVGRTLRAALRYVVRALDQAGALDRRENCEASIDEIQQVLPWLSLIHI